MKTFIALFALINFSFIGAQNSGLVKYDVSVIETNSASNQKSKIKQNKNSNLKLVYNSLNENVKKFHFQLKFLSNLSSFGLQNSMASDNESLKYQIAKALLEATNKYYIDNSENLKLTQINAYGQKFIVKDSLPKWKLHNETKTIGNYICYKATTSRRIVNTKGTFYKDVEAWYTPELTVPFGPKGYGGLPGLIIELTEDKITYYATKIDLTYKIKKINKPIKGRIISNKELLEIGEQATENKGW